MRGRANPSMTLRSSDPCVCVVWDCVLGVDQVCAAMPISHRRKNGALCQRQQWMSSGQKAVSTNGRHREPWCPVAVEKKWIEEQNKRAQWNLFGSLGSATVYQAVQKLLLFSTMSWEGRAHCVNVSVCYSARGCAALHTYLFKHARWHPSTIRTNTPFSGL